MNDMILYQQPTSEMQLMISGLKGVEIGNADPTDVASALSAAIDAGIFYHRLNMDETDRNMMKAIAIRDVYKKFKWGFSVEEITLAIENGYHGTYGEVKGISNKDIYNWLIAYKTDQLRLTKKKELEKEDSFSKPPSLDEQRIILSDILRSAWDKYKQDSTFFDTGNVVFNILSHAGKMTFTEKQIDSFMAMAKSNLLAFHTPEKHIGNPIKVAEALKIVTDIKNGNSEFRIISEAKRLAVNHFFAKLKEKNIELEDLFK